MGKLNLLKFDISYNIARKPAILIYMFVFPVLMFVLLGMLLSGRFTASLTSFDYFGITVMIYFQLTMGTMASNMIMEENVKLPNMRIAYSLVNERYIYYSKVAALMICDALAIFIYMLVLKCFFGVDYGNNMLVVFAAYIILGFFSVCLGVFLCILLRDESSCNNILGVVQLVLCLLGGIFFPVSVLGKAGLILSDLSIVKWINYGIGSYVYGSDPSGLAAICLIAFICSVILLKITGKIFRIQLFIS
ncbi:ABC transporter permease [Ruminococcus sp.]|uniref:ABC transporter permease n=1 Tax=Ruminococcus sp. TaxID=41978 RepID=UPI002585B932|nr:ABC transporter permease [Ruminococcus sp.]MCR5021532.1 ABC transporter permease [Ruminococcus sp.]